MSKYYMYRYQICYEYKVKDQYGNMCSTGYRYKQVDCMQNTIDSAMDKFWAETGLVSKPGNTYIYGCKYIGTYAYFS